MSTPIHVASKRNNVQNAVCFLDDRPMPPLADSSEWGIVPAWGYARVIDSTIWSIKPDSLLFGLWPMSPHPVDLRPEGTEPTGRWREINPHRGQLMTLYNHYEQVDEGSSPEAVTALGKSAFLAAFLLSAFVFADPALYPSGTGNLWTEHDADLSSAVVVSLSASSKTGRTFSWNLARNRNSASHGPLAFLQISSVPDSLAQYPGVTLPMKYAHYNEPDAMVWVSGFKPARIVIVDFGAPKAVGESMSAAASRVSPSVTFLRVGAEAKMYSDAELAELRESMSSPGTVMLNTSAVRDRAMEVKGPAEFFRQLNEAWARCYGDWEHQNLQLKSFHGVEGARGIEGLWQDLCSRKISPNTGTIVHM
ncbi:hypothetical protein DL765_002749 [Monosporascus sp. GIB2]|nr:hypothetical protein DL765_002749 [Monosporascus sp. GIB2]